MYNGSDSITAPRGRATTYTSPITYVKFYNQHQGDPNKVGDTGHLFNTIGNDYVIVGGIKFEIPEGLVEFLKKHGQQIGGYMKTNRNKKRKRINKSFKYKRY